MAKSDNTTNLLTPPLKWAGGKRWLVPHLKPLWTQSGQHRLVEPFCGGLAVALGLNPDRALLNDINPHVVNFYACIRKGLRITIPMHNDRETYYANRKEFNRLIEAGKLRTSKAASLFYYLNRTGYNGLCRFNRKGVFNVPFGKYRTINYKRSFGEYRSVLARWDFCCTDFETLRVGKSDFVYADPPYDVEFRQYAQAGFEWSDQERLARWLAAHKGPVVASNQATAKILKLYRGLGFEVKLLHGPRRISCTGDRKPAQEMLATRNLD